MIGPITSALTNSGLTNLVQSTSSAVTTETVLKAIGRPGFILIDNNISPETKKYAAAKEFLYQATCLAVYMALVVPVFRKGAFKYAKNHLFKDMPEAGFNHFKDLKNYDLYRKLSDKSIEDRQHLLNINKLQDRFTPEIKRELLTHDEPEAFSKIKGSIEAGSLLGSVIGLAILAPQVSHAFIHPALRLLGLEENKPKQHENNNTLNKTA